MNYDIEDILKKQALRKARPALDDRVLSALRAEAGRDVRNTDSSVGWRVSVGWGLAAAAAVAVVAFVLHMGGPAGTPATDGTATGTRLVEAAPVPERASPLPVPDRVNAELQAGDAPRSALRVTGGATRAAAVAATVGRPEVVETTRSEWGAGSVLVLDGNQPVQPVVHRTVRYTRWTDPARNIRIERTVPASQVFLVKARVI
ncbi:MAG: hypothetical protein A3K19_08650 [Lentisphaerae bacterium RIFOXYB12_FULL_65_16]|nr:MAG: hypothetical protein A3K18_05615 [Lentisphaerae bacterium RIFOXYA12_64_32]OGV89485.1 MAG: hypothetical protein A3K19_08650 [Lentisphaerae bacterium RIFOXYB12_FULL_65_16]